MRPLLLTVALLTLGVSTLAAQRMGGRGGMGTDGRPMMGARRPPEAPDAEALDGPLTPDSMAAKFQLDPLQATRYRTSWDSLMTTTSPVRDSARRAMDDFRRARAEGYQHEGYREITEMHRLGKRLEKENDHFDKVTQRILTKDQWRDFKDWRKRRRETAHELRRQRAGEGGMGAGRSRRDGD